MYGSLSLSLSLSPVSIGRPIDAAKSEWGSHPQEKRGGTFCCLATKVTPIPSLLALSSSPPSPKSSFSGPARSNCQCHKFLFFFFLWVPFGGRERETPAAADKRRLDGGKWRKFHFGGRQRRRGKEEGGDLDFELTSTKGDGGPGLTEAKKRRDSVDSFLPQKTTHTHM